MENAAALAVTLNRKATSAPNPAVMPPVRFSLSERGVEVMRSVAAGLTMAEAAERLLVSRRRVEAHFRRI